ncbi:DUF4247 domain-containing protein [Corynebacterium mastitidis]|uniref:DUF4247 domain-containing protein n=1 Tax=Corynebacterium mastitidis TaxID=161890 RepID=A0ABU8NX60_9CORY
MRSVHYYLAALCCAVLAVLILAIKVTGINSGVQTISKNFEHASDSTYYCEEDPEATANEVERLAGAAQARATDKGTVYLRYKDNLVTISGQGRDCRITVEDLSRVHGGSFLFLGPGFSPGAPSNSSSGSSGSGSGAGSVK